MNTTDTSTTDFTNPQCNVWSPIVVIILQALGIGISSIKYFLGNRKHAGLLDSLKSLIVKNDNPVQTEQVQLDMPEELKASIKEE